MEESYYNHIFEQITPYLQWLKAHDDQLDEIADKVNNMEKTGKRIRKFPFSSCDENIALCGLTDLTNECDWIIFTGTQGYADKRCEQCFEYFINMHEDAGIIYADEDYLGTFEEMYGRNLKIKSVKNDFSKDRLYRGEPWFKPEYSPDTLQSFFYFGNIFALSTDNIKKWLETLSAQYGITVDEVLHDISIYELVLFGTGQLSADGGGIYHLPFVLYTNGYIKLKDKLYGADSEWKKNNRWNLIHLNESDTPLISIIIPSKDNSDILKRCIETLVKITEYKNYEIIIVDNGSCDSERLCITSFIDNIIRDSQKTDTPENRIQYVYDKKEFNFSYMCNLGVAKASGEYLLFLNDDIEIIRGDWLKNMLSQALHAHTGAVGAKLYYPVSDEKEEAGNKHRIQHVGITNMGIGPAHKLSGRIDEGNIYHGHNVVTMDMIAITAACLLVSKSKFDAVGGFDEELAVAYNDVELCFKLYEAGYYNVIRNDAVLIHHESLSRGKDDISPDKIKRLENEKKLLYSKHKELIGKDPFYSNSLVQWRKDINYTCNFIYPYEETVKPQEYNKSEKLPKEFTDKYLRKLSGDSLPLLQVDELAIKSVYSDELPHGINDSEHDTDKKIQVLLINGWYVYRKYDNALLNRYLVLQNTENLQVYDIAIEPKLRQDVYALMEDDTTVNTALSGIEVHADISDLPKGRYRLGLLIEKKSTSDGVFPFRKRHITWFKDEYSVIEI